MILDTHVVVRWSGSNRRHYEALGYVFGGNGQEFVVLVKHLSKSSIQKIRVKCDMCNTEQLIQWNGYIRRSQDKYFCNKCSKKSRALSLDFVKNEFIKRDYIPIFTKYQNAHQKLPYICKIHPEKEQYISFTSLYYNNRGCYHCGIQKLIAKQLGEKHHGYKGLEPLTRYLRELTKNWVEEIKFKHNYTCELSGKRGKAGLEVHHLYPFHLLRDDILKILGLNKKAKKNILSEPEHLKLLEVFQEHHNKSKYAVITKDLHDLFHNIYSQRKFTPENFSEFKERYLAGEFDD